jgi:hypothetical protein
MVIGKPRISEEGEDILISAAITNRPVGVDMPENLWFKVSNYYLDGVTDRRDAFLVAMLPVAMALGDDLEIKGTVSSRLFFGLREYQRILQTWWPKLFVIVNLKCTKTANGTRANWPTSVGSTFSGGVDSFYTLHRHRATNEVLPEYRLTHCMTINGFDNDIDLEHTGLFQVLRETYEPMLRSQGIKFVELQTNMQQFRLAAMARENLHLTFGMPLAAAAMVLGNLFARFYIPASHQYDHLVPDGSHPMLDHLLSTESLQIIHDGASASRVEKTIAIAGWHDTHSRLRVCFRGARYNPEQGVFENCGTCEKCLRTMIPLEVAGFLARFSTFPIALARKNIRRIRYLSSSSRSFAIENLYFSWQGERWDLVADLTYVVIRGKLFSILLHPLFRMLPKKIRVWVKDKWS